MNWRAHRLCMALSLSIGLLSAPVRADSLVPDSFAESLAQAPGASWTDLYAAGLIADGALFGAMARNPGRVVALVALKLRPGALAFPALLPQACAGSLIETCPQGIRMADATQARGGVGWRGDDFGLFYTGGFLGVGLRGGFYPGRALGMLGLAAANLVAAPVVSQVGSVRSALHAGMTGGAVSYLAGVTASPWGTDVRLAYAGGDAGHGIYASAAHAASRVGASAIWRPQAGDVPMWTLGLQAAPGPARWFVDAEQARLLPRDMLTTLQLRATTFAPPPGSDGKGDAAQLWLYFEETNAPTSWGSFDLITSVGVHPEAYLHGLMLAWHTDTLHAPEPGQWDAGVALGVAGSPQVRYLGMAGGYTHAWFVQGRYGPGLAVQIGQNSRQEPAIFPWFAGTWLLSVTVSTEGW